MSSPDPAAVDTAAPGALRAASADAPAAPRPRWAVWRSPADQPRWSRPALLAVAAFAALLYACNIATSGYAYFYSVAVKSMSVSWKAFFYGALDPGATVTIDKLAGSFLPQALSARVFGFHEWSVTLPQVIEGVIAVLLIHRIVRRWAGPRAAILAAALFAITPVCASMFGHPMEDSALTLCLILAAGACQRAVMEGRLRSLLMAGVWVGLGFQCKMLQAWIILPALAAGYLVAAPPRLRGRVAHLLLGGVVTLAVSASWMLLMTLTPAQDRPYIDGSTDNSAFAMVVGYNGLGRFGIHVDGAVGGMGSGGAPSAGAGRAVAAAPGRAARRPAAAPGGSAAAPATAGPRGGGPGGGSGWDVGKLFGESYATQIGWLYPLAFISLVYGLARWRGRGRTDTKAAGYLMWGVWLATTFTVFSRIDIPHTAYLATLAPALAAVCAAGTVDLWRAYRAGGATAWLLPATIAAEAAWTVRLLQPESGFLPWLTPVVIAAAAVAVVVLVLARLTARARGRVIAAGVLTGLGAMVLAPGAWAASVLDSRYGGSAFDAGAGPSGGIMASGVRDAAFLPVGRGPGAFPGGTSGGASAVAGPGGMTQSATLDAGQARLLAYVEAHDAGTDYVMATGSWTAAAAYILATGARVMPMGGFSGSVPEPTLAAVKALVASGKLRFFLLGGTVNLGALLDGGGTVPSITDWVRSACAEVPATAYGGGTASGDGALYDCPAGG